MMMAQDYPSNAASSVSERSSPHITFGSRRIIQKAVVHFKHHLLPKTTCGTLVVTEGNALGQGHDHAEIADETRRGHTACQCWRSVWKSSQLLDQGMSCRAHAEIDYLSEGFNEKRLHFICFVFLTTGA